jgi:hypothetical protein
MGKYAQILQCIEFFFILLPTKAFQKLNHDVWFSIWWHERCRSSKLCMKLDFASVIYSYFICTYVTGYISNFISFAYNVWFMFQTECVPAVLTNLYRLWWYTCTNWHSKAVCHSLMYIFTCMHFSSINFGGFKHFEGNIFRSNTFLQNNKEL